MSATNGPVALWRLFQMTRLLPATARMTTGGYRSAEPVLTPVLPQERHGAVPNVVFPTGIDRRDDLGSPDRFDVYYGMADNRIGVARLDLPDFLPPRGVADPPEGRV